MKKTVYLNDFRDEFIKFNRENQFSYDGLEALYNYIEDLEASIGEEMELDIIGLSSEFTEYENLEEFNNQYNMDYEYIEDITEHTQVININDTSFIIQDF